MSTDDPRPGPPDDPAPAPQPSDSGEAAGGDEPDVDLWGYPSSSMEPGSAAERAAADAVAARRDRELRESLSQVDVRIDELAAEVTRVGGLHTDLAATVSEDLGPRLGALWELCREEIGQLRTAVADILAEQDKQKNPPVDWIAMTEQRATKEWPILARWIGERLVPWYELTRDDLPDCWSLHPPAVVELSWLRSAHVQSYLAHTHPHITAEWHARWRPFVVARIKEAISAQKCRPGEHDPTHGAPMSIQTADPAPGPGGLPQRSQLASPQHWWPFYQQAYHADLAARRERDALGERNWTPPPLPPNT